MTADEAMAARIAKTPCMGGYCNQREFCPQYHVDSGAYPYERMCLAGQDGNLKPQFHAVKAIKALN